MMLIAAGWITILLLVGGIALMVLVMVLVLLRRGDVGSSPRYRR